MAAAVRSAITAAVGAFAVTKGMSARTAYVARGSHARKVGRAPTFTVARSVGADAAARRSRVAAHVTRRTLATEFAMAARPAKALAVTTLSAAGGIVAGAVEVAGRSGTGQRATFTDTAQAAAF